MPEKLPSDDALYCIGLLISEQRAKNQSSPFLCRALNCFRELGVAHHKGDVVAWEKSWHTLSDMWAEVSYGAQTLTRGENPWAYMDTRLKMTFLNEQFDDDVLSYSEPKPDVRLTVEHVKRIICALRCAKKNTRVQKWKHLQLLSHEYKNDDLYAPFRELADHKPIIAKAAAHVLDILLERWRLHVKNGKATLDAMKRHEVDLHALRAGAKKGSELWIVEDQMRQQFSALSQQAERGDGAAIHMLIDFTTRAVRRLNEIAKRQPDAFRKEAGESHFWPANLSPHRDYEADAGHRKVMDLVGVGTGLPFPFHHKLRWKVDTAMALAMHIFQEVHVRHKWRFTLVDEDKKPFQALEPFSKGTAENWWNVAKTFLPDDLEMIPELRKLVKSKIHKRSEATRRNRIKTIIKERFISLAGRNTK